MNQFHKILRKGLLFLLLFSGVWISVQQTSAQSAEVLVLSYNGAVLPGMARYLERGVNTAERQGMEAMVLILDTPGGAVDTTLEIVQAFQRSSVPVIVFVGPAGAQAASAGSIITLAAHASGMAPQTVIGAATPVGGDGQDLGETIQRKIIEDLKAVARGLAERRGPEAVELAEAMIEEARAVNSNEALTVGFIDAVAVDVDDLLRQLDGLEVAVNGAPVTLQLAGAAQRPLDLNFVESLMLILANPIIISILLFIGAQGILAEITNPGSWVPGIVGVACLVLAFYGLGMLPANYLGLGLVALAFVLFVAEAFTPTFGALALGGVVSLVLGLLMLFNSPGSPEFARISIPGAILISLAGGGFFFFLAYKALQAQTRQSVTGSEGLQDQRGVVRQPFTANRPDATEYQGMVLVAGELWQARAAEPLQAGDPVAVVSREGFVLYVKGLSAGPPAAPERRNDEEG
jgi:membrane-bound serine protease (ClpP class)